MKVVLQAVLSRIKDPVFWKNIGPAIIRFGPKALYSMCTFGTFFLLLITFMAGKVFESLERIPLLKIPLKKLHSLWNATGSSHLEKLLSHIDKTGSSEIKRSFLINVAYRNMLSKKTRSLITIFGMSVGVGIIVLLLSFGYGIERLIISQVASLDELKIIDVSTGGNTSLRLSDNLLTKIKKVANVGDVIPLISIVGRVTYNKAKTDVLVYAAPNSYLERANIKIKKGKLFTNNKLNLGYTPPSVAGAFDEAPQAKLGTPISDKSVLFTIVPGKAQVVRSDCTTDASILGMTFRIEGGYSGKEYWGSRYAPFSGDGSSAYDPELKKFLGKWVKGKVALYYQSTDTEYRPALDDAGRQRWVQGCLYKTAVTVVDVLSFPQVLGEATASAELATDTATDSAELLDFTEASSAASIELIDIEASQAAKISKETNMQFKEEPSYQGVVSQAMLNLLGINIDSAVGSKFKVSFIVSKTLFPEIEGKAKTNEVTYSIIGVTDDQDQPYFYIPISDMQKLGANNYSQMKIVLTKTDSVASVRKQVEVLGLRTASTADTVTQIESLFASLRIILGLLGLVALGVASLGMFNTLTVSLLERTREIGGMKTMGMVSDEVQDLFLAEAMFMGLSGGIGGLFLGFFTGKLISALVSVVAVTRGQGFLDLTYIPVFLVIFILISSFFVGLITGLYPARRARKISALNALRYE